MLASPLVHLRSPTFIDSPIGGEFVDVFKKTDRQAGGVGSAQGRGLFYRRTYDWRVQNISLELHQKIVRYHSTIYSQKIGSNIGVFGHRISDFSDLVGSRL